MAKNSKISWTDHTWNPWWGCVKVSPACDHCYAESFSKRVGESVWGIDAPRRFFGDKHWNEPLKWNRTALADFGRPARVFCASMADVFEDRDELITHRGRLFGLIKQTPNLLWNLLTKRSTEIKRYLPVLKLVPNARIGVTVENQTYDHRIVDGVSWLSVEPMLGTLDLARWIGTMRCMNCCYVGFEDTEECPDCGASREYEYGPIAFESGLDPDIKKPQLDWVIVGGESGAGAREMKLEWAVDLIQQCKEAGVAVHFKQTGDVLARKLGLKDKSGKDPSEWPAELRIQEFPVLAAGERRA